MGREVRMVPPNWEHPKTDRYYDDRFQPMYDEHIDTALATWLADFDRIRAGNMTDLEREFYANLADWMADHSPPNPQYYRPWRDEDATWFQVWETVSEGTPVTPPFATKAELVDYLVNHGDFWDQKRGHGRRSRASAEAFVNSGWAPSMVAIPGVGLLDSYDSASELGRAKGEG